MDDPQDKPQGGESLADVLDGKGVPFWSSGAAFLIRQPGTEEYDDAMAIQRMVLKVNLASPELRPLKDLPCSDEERAVYEGMIEAAQRLYDASDPDERAKREALKQRLDSLRKQLVNRTLADEEASARAVLARDRYLCQRLLCDESGEQLLDPTSKDFPEQWERLPLGVKNDARPAIWTVISMVRDAPFDLALLHGRSSA